VALLDDRFDAILDPGADGVADQPLLVGEQGVEIEKIDSGETAQGGPPRRS